MQFSIGVMQGGVWQRNAAGVSEQPFAGTCETAARRVTVAFNGKTLAEVPVRKGQFSGVVKGIPAGGPYTLRFTAFNAAGKAVEKLQVGRIYVGDLWLLGGQSNMEGNAYLPAPLPVIPEVRAYYMNDRWDAARDPIHNLYQAAAPVHCGNPDAPTERRPKGGGPGVSFGQAMFAATGVPQGLISCAHGGTSMSQWDPQLRDQGGKSLYGAMYQRFVRLGSSVAGMIWFQGCNDTSPDACADYLQRMLNFVKALRRDVKNADLPIVIAQLNRQTMLANDAGWTIVREAQRELPHLVKRLAMVVTNDLDLDDQIHLSTASQITLGKRFAKAMLALRTTGKPPVTPDVAGASVRKYDDFAYEMVIRFSGVQGSLHTAETLGSKFRFYGNDFQLRDAPIRTVIEKDRVRLLCTSVAALCRRVGYGCGGDPATMIHDDAGNPLPSFAIALAHDPRFSDFLLRWEVSGPVTSGKGATSLALPGKSAKPVYGPTIPQVFYVTFPQRAQCATRTDKVFHFRSELTLEEAMELEFRFGADAPFALYCNGEELMRDEACTNPVIIDQYRAVRKLAKGKHQLHVAVYDPKGMFYGISLRFKRLDGGKKPKLPTF